MYVVSAECFGDGLRNQLCFLHHRGERQGGKEGPKFGMILGQSSNFLILLSRE